MKHWSLTLAVTVLACALCGSVVALQGAPLKGGSPVAQKALAQSGKGGQDRMAEFKKRQQEMYAKLKLSAAQKKKADALFAQQMKDRQALRDAPGDRESKRAKFEALRKKNDEAWKKILTPTQYKQLEEMRKQMRSRSGGQGAPGGPAGKGAPTAGLKGGKTGKGG